MQFNDLASTKNMKTKKLKKFLLPLVIVVCLMGDTSTGAITATITTATTASQLGNISTRGFVQTGNDVMIGGFIIQGTQPKTVIVRAIGPELIPPPYNISNALANPNLELHDGAGALIASNNNWRTTIIGGIITSNQVSAIQNSGHAPTQPSESAIIATLPPGNYTAIVSGVNNTTGVALVEVYDLSPDATSILGNISTRDFVQTGDSVMIGGFIIPGTGPKTVIVRAIGPELIPPPYNITNALVNPTLELHDGTGALIAQNDNWQKTEIGGIITSNQVNAIQNSGHAPTQPSESAIIATLPPGNYTVIVSGVNNTTGVALVEVYDLESTPIPLTPLTLSTTGIDPTSPVSVSFFNSAGFSVSYQPIRVESDGTVVVAVPLYVDPSTNNVTSGTVSMILTQGSNSSPPISLDIQNLPTLDAYGTQLGEISHAVLVYEATLLGRRLNELQAFQILPGNTVDTSQAQATLKSRLSAVIKARSDVDRVMIDNSVVIANGAFPDGAPIRFDKDSLDIMDRMNALFLTQTIVPLAQSSGLSSSGLSSSGLSSSASPLSQTTTASSGQAGLSASQLKDDLAVLEKITGVNAIGQSALKTSTVKNWTDIVEASATGLGGVAATLPKGVIEESSKYGLGALGSILGSVDILSSVCADDAAFLYGAVTGDQALMNISLNAMNSLDRPKLFNAFTDLTLTLLGGPTFPDGWNNVSTVGGFIKSYYDFGEAALVEADTKYQPIDLEYPTPFTSPTQGIAQITGIADISSNQGIAAPQSSINLCCMGASALEIQGIADPSGDFDLFVPLGVPNTPYNSLTLNAFDFISDITLSSETVDLSGLDTSQPVQVPTMISTCDDTDAGNPDGDDPDCD
ncbi:unnamed protein product [uncultured bacterium]|nr:unnamed protein product [uncultured bacterium]